MKVSAKTEYASIAMIELAASHASGEPVRIRTIAGRHGIPSRFLVQILLQLKGAGLVVSTRGAAGGYRLAKPPEEITLLEVMSVVDSQPGEVTSSTATRSPAVDVLLNLWQEIHDVEQQRLASVSLAELAAGAQSADENMYYI